MIYFPERRIAIITPPHTASGSLHKTLCRHPFDGIWVHGPDPYIGAIDHHYAGVQNSWVTEGVKTYLVVRNPYDRMIGLYLHYSHWVNEIPDRTLVSWDDNFLEFASTTDLHWIFSKTISQIIKDYDAKYDEIIRYENIEEEVSKILGENVVLPEKYHDFNILEEWYGSADILGYINENWAIEDCEEFGYEQIMVQ